MKTSTDTRNWIDKTHDVMRLFQEQPYAPEITQWMNACAPQLQKHTDHEADAIMREIITGPDLDVEKYSVFVDVATSLFIYHPDAVFSFEMPQLTQNAVFLLNKKQKNNIEISGSTLSSVPPSELASFLRNRREHQLSGASDWTGLFDGRYAQEWLNHLQNREPLGPQFKQDLFHAWQSCSPERRVSTLSSLMKLLNMNPNQFHALNWSEALESLDTQQWLACLETFLDANALPLTIGWSDHQPSSSWWEKHQNHSLLKNLVFATHPSSPFLKHCPKDYIDACKRPTYIFHDTLRKIVFHRTCLKQDVKDLLPVLNDVIDKSSLLEMLLTQTIKYPEPSFVSFWQDVVPFVRKSMDGDYLKRFLANPGFHGKMNMLFDLYDQHELMPCFNEKHVWYVGSGSEDKNATIESFFTKRHLQKNTHIPSTPLKKKKL